MKAIKEIERRPPGWLDHDERNIFFNGLHVASRDSASQPWRPLIEGFRVIEDDEEIMIQTPESLRYYFGYAVLRRPGKPDSYIDSGKPIEIPCARPCPKCGRFQSPQGFDPCIANLPGVLAACCGHGVQPGYITFANGTEVRGFFDVEHLGYGDATATARQGGAA